MRLLNLIRCFQRPKALYFLGYLISRAPCPCSSDRWAYSFRYLMDQSTNRLLLAFDSRQFCDQDSNKDQDSGFGEPDHWRFTPSILDTNSFAFASFANHHSSDFGSTPGGTNTVFHNDQAGDLHTPGMGFQLGTPLSVPNSTGQNDATAAIDMHAFHTHLLHSQPFQNSSLFTPQQSYAPSSFIHQDTGYETMEGPNHAMLAQRSSIDEELPRESAFIGYPAGHSDNLQAHTAPAMERSVIGAHLIMHRLTFKPFPVSVIVSRSMRLQQ